MSTTSQRILVYGSKVFAKTVRHLVESCGFQFAGFVDDFSPESTEVLGSLDKVSQSHSPQDYAMALGVGYSNLNARWKCWIKAKELGYEFPRLVHNNSITDPSSSIGEGSMVMAGAVVDHSVIIDEAVVIWPLASINHNSRICRNTFISPGATICGSAMIGTNVFVGAGSIVVDRCSVPDSTFVKAGKVFVK